MKQVLIVDDEFFVKQSLSMVIERTGLPFKVIDCVDNGVEALEVLENYTIDLLITDINMPLMNGFELIEQLKKRKLAVEIIILSGYNDFEYVQTAIQYHVHDYWLKPIKVDKVQATLFTLQEEWKVKEDETRLRSKSLPRLITLAQQLINHVWTLQQDAITHHIEQFIQLAKTTVSEYPNYSLSQIYYDFIVLLDEEINKISNNQINMKVALELEWSGLHSELITQLNTVISDLCDLIRQNRNLGYSKLMNEAIHYIAEQYRDCNLSVNSTASYINMSPAYFSRLFKSTTDMTFTQYLIEFRLKKAKELLTQHTIKALEVCYEVGYQDYPHFAKAFKKKYNVSPTEYKKTIS